MPPECIVKPKTSSSKLKIAAKVTLSIGLLGYLFYRIGTLEIAKVLRDVNLFYVLLAVLLYLLGIILGSAAIKNLFQKEDNISIRVILKAYTKAWFIGLISPEKVGEFSIVYYLKKKGVEVSKSTAIFLADKITNISILLLIAVGGMYFVLKDFNLLLITIVCAIASMLIFLLLITKIARRLIKKILAKFKITQLNGMWNNFCAIEKHNKAGIAKNILLNFAKWYISAIIISVIFLGFGVHPPFMVVFAITAIEKIVSYIPISLGGLGVKEITAVYVYSLQGVHSAIVLANYLVCNVINYGLATIFVVYNMGDK